VYSYTLYQRLFNFIDDNALINPLGEALEVGHEVDIAAKAHRFVFCEPANVANSWQNFPASPAEKFGR
jgi:hypothetical protein